MNYKCEAHVVNTSDKVTAAKKKTRCFYYNGVHQVVLIVKFILGVVIGMCRVCKYAWDNG